MLLLHIVFSWFRRSGHQVSVTVNSLPATTLAMVLDSTGMNRMMVMMLGDGFNQFENF